MPDQKKPEKIPSKKVRGSLLTAWLSLMMIIFVLVTIAYIGVIVSDPQLAQSMAISIPFVLYYLLAIIALAGAVCTYYLFKWRLWALYGIFGVTVVSFIINVAFVGLLDSVLGIIGFIVLLFLFRNKIKLLE